MPFDEDPSEANHSDQQINQNAFSNVTARDIQIGSIVQTIATLGLPFNSQHLRFVQFLANSAYLICLIGGFIRLWRKGADATTLGLIIVGCALLSLTCLYYSGFWKPEVRDKSAPSSAKKQSRQRTRRLAIIGILAIPLLTGAGFLGWQSLPPTRVLLLVANFANSQNADYRDDRQVTENILRNLRRATQPYADVKVQPLNQTITEQQGSDIARAVGEQRKATLVIWGNYAVTPTNVQVSTHFEVLKPPDSFPELGETASGKAQTAAIAELNSFQLQARLSNEMSYLTLFTLGMVQYAKAYWDGAITRFSDALAQSETTLTALDRGIVFFKRGTSFLYKEDYKNAISDFNQAIKLKPGYTGAYNNRGIVHDHQGKYSLAISDFNQVMQLKPNYAEAYNNRGTAYAHQGNRRQAITDYNQAIQLKPNYAKAYNNRGLAYADQDNDKQAVADYNQAIQLKPDYAEAYNNRGLAYGNQGNYSQAIADYNQAIQLKPDYAEAYTNRGTAYYGQGNYSQAKADYNQSLQLKPKPDYNGSMNIVQNPNPDYYNRGDGNAQNVAEAHNNRGIVYADRGDYSEAIADFTQAIQLKPDFAEAYYNKARVYSLQREVKAAIENLQRAIALNGKYREMAKTDSDFDRIRKDQQFQALVGK